MIRVDEALRENFPQAKLILQVHDELIVECPEELATEVSELVSSQMQQVAKLSVPLLAEAKWGTSWYEAK
jgi:DNA polymerase-1